MPKRYGVSFRVGDRVHINSRGRGLVARHNGWQEADVLKYYSFVIVAMFKFRKERFCRYHLDGCCNLHMNDIVKSFYFAEGDLLFD
jgi:hypothetical protein